MLNVGGGEVVLLILAALIILGPSRLPQYALRLAEGVRRVRDLAEGAKAQIKTEMGPAFEDVDWRQLDPRQYDPRRIVREALMTPSTPTPQGAALEPVPAQTPASSAASMAARVVAYDPARPTPFDVDAT